MSKMSFYVEFTGALIVLITCESVNNLNLNPNYELKFRVIFHVVMHFCHTRELPWYFVMEFVMTSLGHFAHC